MRGVGGDGGGMEGVKNVEKMTHPPFFVSEIISLFFLFDFDPKKCFRVPTLGSLYGAEWDEG